MKFLKLLLIFLVLFFTNSGAKAIEFKLLVLPTNIFEACENYFCFPEVSNIIAEDTINNFYKYKNIKVQQLANVRDILEHNPQLKSSTKQVLDLYAKEDRIDFSSLKHIAEAFDVKSILLINSYAINDKVTTKRGLWDILEISSAFQITYPYELKTTAILTDCVNNVIMWSGKYNKEVSNSEGYYSATNLTQAMSQLEKVKLYSKDNISQNISQNVFMRFFPREVRTFYITKPNTEKPETQFRPNALEQLKDSNVHKQLNTESFSDFGTNPDDLIFEF